MIEDSLMNLLKNEIDDLEWTVDYFTASDDSGTVFATSPSQPDDYDTEYRFPSYQVFIRSSNFFKAKQDAIKAYDALHKKKDFTVKENDKEYYVYFIKSSSDIIRLGVQDGVMEYSINFDTTIREVN